MNTFLLTSLIGLFFGTIGTMIGGIIGINIKHCSNRLLSLILSFASGLMIAVVCFDLIPEALKISNISIIALGMMLGFIIIFICDILIHYKFKKKNKIDDSRLLITGIIIAIGIAMHNFPEGLAIGSGYEVSSKLGLSLAIAICIHDIPEGLSMAIPMKSGGLKSWKILIYIFLSGIVTGVGSFVGSVIGTISLNIISTCLSLAAGAMLFIVSCELMPEASKLGSGRVGAIGTILGIMLGLIIMNL